MKTVAEILTPHRDLIMVLEDEATTQTTSGLFVPDDLLRPGTGTILDVGPRLGEDSDYYPGRRVLYRPGTGSLVGFEGTSKKGAIRFFNPHQIHGFLDDCDTEEVPWAQWADHAVAPPGYLLVQRVEMPIERGLVLLPDGARVHVRSNEAIVRSIGRGVVKRPEQIEVRDDGEGCLSVLDYEDVVAWQEGFWIGQRITINGPLGDELRFGDRGEVRLWKIAPDNTQATVNIEDASLRVDGEDPLRSADLSEVPPPPDVPEVSEGDPGGLR